LHRLYSLFTPADGLLSIRTVDAPDDLYLIWVDDILIGRATAADLSQAITLSPTYLLSAPNVVRLQGVLHGSEIEGFVWLQQPAVSNRLRAWTKSRSVGHRRAMFLACEALPEDAQQRQVIAEIQRVFGGYFDSYGTAILQDSPVRQSPDNRLTVDVQIYLDVRGLQETDAATILKDRICDYDPVACIPLDMASAAYAPLMGNLPVLLGPWLTGDLPAPSRGVRWQINETENAIDFDIDEHRMNLQLPAGPTGMAGVNSLLRNWCGSGGDEALAPTQEMDLLRRLNEIGGPMTILLVPGATHASVIRKLPDVNFTTLEMAAHGGRRFGLNVETFSWDMLAGRTLIYLGKDQDLDTLLAGQCRNLGHSYRSAFSSIAAAATVDTKI
jgi:hypothetical protein